MKKQNFSKHGMSNWIRQSARVAPLLVAFVATACVGDKTADDYRRQVVSEALARIQGIQGNYRGEMVSSDGRQSLGFVNLSLNPETQVQKSSDNLKSERQAVVRGTMRFMSSELNANLNFSQGFYDDETGLFEATVPLQTTQAAFAQSSARISGKIVNGAFAGTIDVPGYANYGAELNLVKDGAAQIVPGMTHGRSREVVSISQSFSGLTEIKGEKLKVSLNLEGKETSSEQLFANMLLPSRELVATLKVTYPDGAALVFVFKPASLSYDSDTLTGTNSDRFYQNLTCKRSVSGGVTQAWACKFVATGGSKQVNWQADLSPEGSRL